MPPRRKVTQIPEGSLYAKTKTLLASLPVLELFKVAEATGLSYYWVRRMYYGYIPDPSVNRTQALYEYLSNTKLEVK
jgi:hypothetical protein